jgi:hypothetical protein
MSLTPLQIQVLKYLYDNKMKFIGSGKIQHKVIGSSHKAKIEINEALYRLSENKLVHKEKNSEMYRISSKGIEIFENTYSMYID